VSAAKAAREVNRPTSPGETFRLLAVFAQAQRRNPTGVLCRADGEVVAEGNETYFEERAR
jgi:hypothetical protein